MGGGGGRGRGPLRIRRPDWPGGGGVHMCLSFLHIGMDEADIVECARGKMCVQLQDTMLVA